MTTNTTNVYFLLPELDATKSVTWNCHVDKFQENERYDMIIGQYLLSKIQIDLCLPDFTIRLNEGMCKGFTASMRDTNNSHEIIPSNQLDYASFTYEE